MSLLIIWAFLSFYTVKPEERSIELFFGEYYDTGESGLNFAPWPLITHEVLTVTRENTEDIGVGGRGGRQDEGLMLTGDENIVDIDFQVVWNISDPAMFLFNLAVHALCVCVCSNQLPVVLCCKVYGFRVSMIKCPWFLCFLKPYVHVLPYVHVFYVSTRPPFLCLQINCPCFLCF